MYVFVVNAIAKLTFDYSTLLNVERGQSKMTLPKVRRALELIVKPKPVSTLFFFEMPRPSRGGGTTTHAVQLDSRLRSRRRHQIPCTGFPTNTVRFIEHADSV